MLNSSKVRNKDLKILMRATPPIFQIQKDRFILDFCLGAVNVEVTNLLVHLGEQIQV